MQKLLYTNSGQRSLISQGNELQNHLGRFIRQHIREKKNLKIIATEEKMKGLKCLRVDTGDIEVDKSFKGPTKVVVGYKQELVVDILI